jgi:hypothetical protein
VFFEIIEPEELGYTYRIRPAKDFGAPFVSLQTKMLRYRNNKYCYNINSLETRKPLLSWLIHWTIRVACISHLGVIGTVHLTQFILYLNKGKYFYCQKLAQLGSVLQSKSCIYLVFYVLCIFTYRMKHFLGMEFLLYLWNHLVDVAGHTMQKNWKEVWLWLNEGKHI